MRATGAGAEAGQGDEGKRALIYGAVFAVATLKADFPFRRAEA